MSSSSASSSSPQAQRQIVDDVLRVFVAFDPGCSESCSHARSIYKYLQGGDLDEVQGWTPVPVRYLCSAEALAARELDHAGATPSSAHHNDVLVVMVSDSMLTSAAWRAALRGIEARDAPYKRWVYPVMLTQSMTLLRPFSDCFDPLRLWHKADGAMPVPPPPLAPPLEPRSLAATAEPVAQLVAIQQAAATKVYDADKKEAEKARERWVRRRFGRLRRALADALLRDFGGLSEGSRVKTFLSHAKADGDDVAQHLRDGLARCSRLEAWYDQNDLQAGKSFEEPMTRAAAAASGGFIAVSSPTYASRPWCREEAERARTPRVVLPENGGQVRLVVCQAGVVVQRPRDQWGRTVEALGRVPYIGWPADSATAEALDERTEQVVDRLYLELLLRRRFMLQAAALSAEPDVVFLAFTPDHWTLLKAVQALVRAGLTGGASLIYPGGGLQPADVRALNGAMEALHPGTWSLLSLEEHLAGEASAPPTAAEPSVWVAISGAGVNSELYAAGIGEEHNNDLMVLLTRLIASRGLGVAYGGSLSAPSTDNLVDGLLDTARAWRSAESPLQPARIDTGRFVRNYVAIGFHDKCSDAVRAASLDVCEFILVDAAGQAQPTWSDTLPADTAALRKRDALSAMRVVSTEETDARVMFGGKIKGGPDWMPGVAEELLCSLERGQPVALLSGFGGVAAVLAKVLRGHAELPGFAAHPRLKALFGAIGAYRAAPSAYPVTIIDETDPIRAVEAVGAFLDRLPPPRPKPEDALVHVLYDRATARLGEAS